MTKIIFFVIFTLTLIIRLEAIDGGNIPFTTDQGRDMVDIRNIVVTHKPRLIGPTTSINGVYLGPFWYYFNLPPFIISQGNPAALLVWQIIFYQLAGLASYLLIKKHLPILAIFIAVFFLIMPLGFNTSRYSWNANAMPIFTALFLLTLFLVQEKPSQWRLILLGLTAGLATQIEAALGILFFPFAFLFLLTQTRNLKKHLWHGLGFAITLLPQAVFETRHGFPLSKVLLAEIGGKSSLLGAKLTLAERLSDRYQSFHQLLQQTSHLPVKFLFPLFFLTLGLTLVLLIKHQLQKQLTRFFLINLSFIIFVSLFFLLFPSALKSWYLLGLSVPLVFIYCLSLAATYSVKFPVAKVMVILVVLSSLVYTAIAQVDYLKVASQMSSANKSSLKNSISAIDWVYQHADGQGFKAYSYLPSIYDYPYQYLFWWYGKQKYGYRPNDVAYLPDQPEYIEDRSRFFTSTRTLPADEITFLIIEKDQANPSFELAWLGNFSKLCLLEKIDYSYGVEIRKLQKCLKK